MRDLTPQHDAAVPCISGWGDGPKQNSSHDADDNEDRHGEHQQDEWIRSKSCSKPAAGQYWLLTGNEDPPPLPPPVFFSDRVRESYLRQDERLRVNHTDQRSLQELTERRLLMSAAADGATWDAAELIQPTSQQEPIHVGCSRVSSFVTFNTIDGREQVVDVDYERHGNRHVECCSVNQNDDDDERHPGHSRGEAGEWRNEEFLTDMGTSAAVADCLDNGEPSSSSQNGQPLSSFSVTLPGVSSSSYGAADGRRYVASADVSPFYRTSSSEYGSRPPSLCCLPYADYKRSYAFTSSMAKKGMYRNHSLNL